MQVHLLPTLAATLLVLASVTASAQGVPVAATHYDMLNGYGQAHTGTYNYWDKAYTGSGNTSLDFAPLSGGLGDLTDGVIATQRWDLVENLEGTGPYVGWFAMDPVITFHFAGVHSFSQVTVWHDDANGHGNVATPMAFEVTAGGLTQRFEITDPAGDAPFASTLVLGPGLTGDTLQLQVFRQDTVVMLSEVQISAVPEPQAWLLMGSGVLALLALRRRSCGMRRRGALRVPALLLALAAAWPATASAQTWQLTANLLANAFMTFPEPGVTQSHNADLNLLNQPAAAQLQLLHEYSELPNGGSAEASFLGRVGLLKAHAAAGYPFCCTINGQTVTLGYTNATVQATFYDTVAVSGAGLAAGTPVRYRVDFDISGTVSSPAFEIGGHLSVDGLAQVRLRDSASGAEVSLNWDARRDATGRYALTLDTQVGHELALSGMLYAGGYVDAYATLGRVAQADFYHSAAYSLVPSVAGLNSVGASGFDYLAPVPEPAGWALLLLGLAGFWRAGRVKRCALPAC